MSKSTMNDSFNMEITFTFEMAVPGYTCTNETGWPCSVLHLFSLHAGK